MNHTVAEKPSPTGSGNGVLMLRKFCRNALV